MSHTKVSTSHTEASMSHTEASMSHTEMSTSHREVSLSHREAAVIDRGAARADPSLGEWRRRSVQPPRAALSGSHSSAGPLLALVALLAACAAGEESRFVVNEEDGVRVAENFGPDRPHPATPVRLATLQPPDGALTAVPWGVVADPEGRRIFVADGMSERVVVFDAEGTYLRTLGRAGDGPGEFRSPTALTLDEGGAAVVWDAHRGIISRWSAEGELLDERRAPLNYWGPGFAVRGDDVVAVTMSTTGNVQRQALVRSAGVGNPRSAGAVDPRSAGAVDSRSTGVIDPRSTGVIDPRSTGGGDPLEIAAVTRELVPLELPGMSMPAPRIFAPDLIWTAAGDSTLVLNGPEYRIDVYAGGRLAGSLRRDLAPIAVTGELAAARVGSGPYTNFMRRTGLTAERLVAAIGYEALASPIEWIAVAPSGELWVSRGTGLPVPDRVDVFAPDGRYVGTFDAPGFPVAFLSDTAFVALEITEYGEPVLGLYGLEVGR